MSDIERQSLSSDEGATTQLESQEFVAVPEDEFDLESSFAPRRGGRPGGRPPANRPPAGRPPANRPPTNNRPPNRPRLPKRVVVQQMIDASGVAVAAAQLGVDIATLLGYVNGPVDD